MPIHVMRLRPRVTRKAVIICLILAGVLVISAYAKISLVRVNAGGTLFWHADEAYLFLDNVNEGVQMSCLSYLFEILKAMLGGSTARTNVSCSVQALRISRESVRSYTTDDVCLGSYRFVAGEIYSRASDGSLWKWSGTGFVRASGDEARAYNALAPGGISGFDNVDGWSEHSGIAGGTRDGYEVPFELQGEKMRLVTQQSSLPLEGEVTVDLVTPGQPPQKIWSLDQGTHLVSKAHYERIFHIESHH